MVEKERSKVKEKKEVKIMFACIGTVTITSKVNITILIFIKTEIFICRGRNSGIANVETYRDKQGQTRTYRERQ